jgi:hypothetical protein
MWSPAQPTAVFGETMFRKKPKSLSEAKVDSANMTQTDRVAIKKLISL